MGEEDTQRTTAESWTDGGGEEERGRSLSELLFSGRSLSELLFSGRRGAPTEYRTLHYWLSGSGFITYNLSPKKPPHHTTTCNYVSRNNLRYFTILLKQRKNCEICADYSKVIFMRSWG